MKNNLKSKLFANWISETSVDRTHIVVKVKILGLITVLIMQQWLLDKLNNAILV